MNKQYFMKRLSVRQPSASERYSYDYIPETFFSHDKIPIECHLHGIFYQKACSHLNGSGCSPCAITRNALNYTLTTDEFIHKSQTRFSDNFDYGQTNYTGQDKALIITCCHHGDFIITPRQHVNSKYGCPKCDVEIPRTIMWRKMLERANAVHHGKYDYSRVALVNVSDKVEIICPSHGSFWQDMYTHTKLSVDCPKCMREADKLSLDDFIAKSIAVHGGRYDYSKVVYGNNVSMVKIICGLHGEFTQRAGSHMSGCGCRKCHIEETRLTTEQFIENAREVHGDTYDYSKVIYKGNKVPVEIICPSHGTFLMKPNSHTSTRNGCRLCWESKGEKAVEVCLKKYGIPYIREYRIEPSLYRYDFYLPGLDILIEFNGIQHYQPVEAFGGLPALLNTQERDACKKALAKQHSYRLFVLTYLSLSHGTVEKELIQRFKRACARWYVINGELKVFKALKDVCVVFNILPSVPISEIDNEVSKVVKDFRLLF